MSEENTERHTRAIQLLSSLEGYEGSELAQSRVDAWNYYLQRPRGDEVEGRSPVVTGDVSAMVESCLSQVTEALSTDNLAEFEAFSDPDEFQAKMESATVSRSIMRGKGWFRLATAVKNALLLRMGIMRASVCKLETVNVKALTGVGRLAKIVMEAGGAKFVDYDAKTKTGKVQVNENRQYLDIVSVSPENFLFTQWPLDDFENIPACAERFVTTNQYLIDSENVTEEQVDSLPNAAPASKSDADAHSLKGFQANVMAISQRQKQREWFKLYYLDNGKRYCAIVAANKVLSEDVVSTRPPYSIGVPFINPGRIDGFSLFDKLKGTQDITTALTRMLNDNANAVTMNRLAVLENAANNDQLTDQDPSGVLQIKRSVAGGDIRNAVLPIQTADLSAGIVGSLNYQRGVRSEMAGASLDVGTGKVQLPDRMGSMGLDRAYSASEQLSSLILKTLSETLIKDLWLLVHEILRTEWTGPLPIKLEGRWEQPEPSQWPIRMDVTVKPGMSPGERNRRSQALGALIQLQTDLAKAGMEGVLVDAERYYRTVCDWARLNDIQRPEQYLIDPSSDAAKQTLAQKAEQTKAANMQAQQLQKMALALEQMGHAVQKYGIDVKAAMEKYKVDADTDKTEASLTVDLVKDREKAERDMSKPPKAPEKAEEASEA